MKGYNIASTKSLFRYWQSLFTHLCEDFTYTVKENRSLNSRLPALELWSDDAEVAYAPSRLPHDPVSRYEVTDRGCMMLGPSAP